MEKKRLKTKNSFNWLYIAGIAILALVFLRVLVSQNENMNEAHVSEMPTTTISNDNPKITEPLSQVTSNFLPFIVAGLVIIMIIKGIPLR